MTSERGAALHPSLFAKAAPFCFATSWDCLFRFRNRIEVVTSFRSLSGILPESTTRTGADLHPKSQNGSRKTMSHDTYAYRIRIGDAPESLDAENAFLERARQIADKLAKNSVHMTEWKSTYVRCTTSFHIDKMLGLLHALGVKPEDITLERQMASVSEDSLGSLEPCLPISRVALVLLDIIVKGFAPAC